MSETERVIIGSIGAGFVHFSTYPVKSGYIHLFSNFDFAEFLGFVVKLIVAMIIGGFWVYLHKDEHNRMKVFQLGIVAPAMIAGLLYANKPEEKNGITQHNDKISEIELNLESTTGAVTNLVSILPKAHAQTVSTDEDEERKIRGFFERFIRGFWGK